MLSVCVTSSNFKIKILQKRTVIVISARFLKRGGANVVLFYERGASSKKGWEPMASLADISGRYLGFIDVSVSAKMVDFIGFSRC